MHKKIALETTDGDKDDKRVVGGPFAPASSISAISASVKSAKISTKLVVEFQVNNVNTHEDRVRRGILVNVPFSSMSYCN